MRPTKAQGAALGYELLPLQGVLLILASCLQDDTAYCASWPSGRATYMGFKLPNLSSCMVDIIQHALKGQKLLAQGIALGIMSVSNAPCFTLIKQALSAFFNVNYV